MASLTSLVPQGYLRGLAPRVRTIVREHRRRLLRDLTGRVLDLGGDADHRPLYPVSSEVVARQGEGPFDHVVSILHLAAVPDAKAELERIRPLLAPKGTFVFLEPAADTGFGARGQRLMAPVAQRFGGWRPDLDVPELLRQTGFVSSDVQRTPLPRYAWPLTDLIEGRALLPATDR